MRRLSLLLLTLLTALALHAAVPDSSRFTRLGEKLDNYVAAIAEAPLPEQETECDFLISSCQDSLDRQFVTVRLYDIFLNSKRMGAENVAVHIADDWILSGKVAMYNELDYINVYAYAEFNRSSLIGKAAPSLTLQDRSGNPVPVAPQGGTGRFVALYFYAPGCATCRVTTPSLLRVLSSWKEDVDLIAVNVDADASAFERYLSSHPDFAAAGTHLWDPDKESDFQRLYGVTQTPQLLLIDPDGIIVGRRLDPPALQQLLSEAFDLYSGTLADEAASLMETVFSTYAGQAVTAEDVMDVAGMIEQRTGGQGRQYKMLTAALLRHVSSRRGHGYRFGADRLSRESILARPDVWNTAMDRLLVVDHVRLLVSLMDDYAPVGSRIARGLRLHGTLYRGDSAREGRIRVRGCIFSTADYLVFYQSGCESCRELLESLEAYRTAHPWTRVLLVDMDRLTESYPDEAESVLTHFDVSSLPHIIHLSPCGQVLDKYLDNLD